METGALKTDSKTIIGSNGYANPGISADQIMLLAELSKRKVKDYKFSTVCKADLISLVNKEEIRKSEALIDSFLKGEITTSLRSPYRLVKV